MVDKLISILAAVFAGGAVGCGALFLLRTLAGVEFERMGAAGSRRLPLVIRLALPFVPLTRRLAASEGLSSWRRVEEPKLWMAGYGETISATDFVAVKLVMSGLLLLLLLLGAVFGRIVIPGLIGLLLAIYPGVWLAATVKRRHLSIMKALPNVIDLLTLSVESGRDLLSSLRDILARRRMDDLGEELTRTFQEIQLGRKRSEALRALADRVRQIDLTATVNAIIQAEELGVSIARQLRIQGDMQRAKRFALAEKLANEAAVKIVLPLVVFIFPAVFIILLGPLVLQTIRVFGG